MDDLMLERLSELHEDGEPAVRMIAMLFDICHLVPEPVLANLVLFVDRLSTDPHSEDELAWVRAIAQAPVGSWGGGDHWADAAHDGVAGGGAGCE